MNKRFVCAAIIGGLLMVCGIALAFCALHISDYDLTAIDMEKWEMNDHVITDDFASISVDTDTSEVELFPSEDGECRVVCHERKKLVHSVTVENGTLKIFLVDNRKWYEHISFFSFGEERIGIYLPKAEYESLYIKNSTGAVSVPDSFSFGEIDISLSTGSVICNASAKGQIKIKATTGKISVDGVSAKDLSLRCSTGNISASSVSCVGAVTAQVSTGKATLTDVSCAELVSTGSTGGITLKNVVATGKLVVTRTTGDIRFDRCDASSVHVKTDTGDVSGSFTSSKIFSASSDTGKVNVPASTEGGHCEIETDTGNIKIDIDK